MIPHRINRAQTLGGHVGSVVAREITEQMTSFRFLAISLLTVGLVPLLVYVGIQDFQARRGDYGRLSSLQQELVAGPAGEEVSGSDLPWTTQNELFVLAMLRPPEPISVLVKGVDGIQPMYWLFTSSGIRSGGPASSPKRLGDLLGRLDIEFLVRVVLGLLAILLAFDSVAGEKEAGTLRMVLSFPVSRGAFLTGKLLGGIVTLLVPLTLAFLVAVLTSGLWGVPFFDRDSLSKLGALFIASMFYLTSSYSLGVLISTMAKSQKTSLVIALLVWTWNVLAAPPLATVVSQVIVAKPSIEVFEAEMRTVDQAIVEDAEMEMGAVYRAVTGSPEGLANGALYLQHKDPIDNRVGEIVVETANRRRRQLGELEAEFARMSGRQNRIARLLMTFSPAAVFASAATDLVGTGDAIHEDWLRAVRSRQSRLEEALFNDPPVVWIRNGGASFSIERRGSSTVADLPRGEFPGRRVGDNVHRALLPTMALLLYSGSFLLGAFFMFARYDAR